MEIKSSISAVSHIHTLAASFLQERLASEGLADFVSSHGNILFQLNKNGSMTMKEIARRINRDKSTTTVLIRKLEKEGFIQKENDGKDRRNIIISLTQKGRNYNEQTEGISKELLEKFYTDFSEEEKKEFCRLLEKVEKNFSDDK
ncbi:MAG: MarR family transcriptional regulator [Treponema sp.]|nr:MarR family transcriptional regulator [Treponema sp.]